MTPIIPTPTAMKTDRVNPAQSGALLLCLLLPFQCAAEKFVELAAEVSFDDWDYRVFKDKSNNEPEQNHKLPSIFNTNSTVRCVVGTNTWMMEFDSENARTTYWFTGTNIIEHMVITKEIPNRPRVGKRFTHTFQSSDGNPGRPVRVPDIMGAGSVCWLSFCSGSFLKRDGRQIFPPSPFWKESSLVYSRWSDKTTAFADGLGLPKSVDLIATNNQPIFQYQVHKSTNVLGWNFPLEFYCFQFLPAGTNLWKLALTAKGRLTSIKEGTKPEIPAEVLERVEK